MLLGGFSCTGFPSTDAVEVMMVRWRFCNFSGCSVVLVIGEDEDVDPKDFSKDVY